MEASSKKLLNSRELPQDLIIRFLLRIPVKSLLRFKLVSKTWNAFLKTPYFISMHHKFNLDTTVSQLLMCSIDKSRTLKGRYFQVFSFYSVDRSVRISSPDLRILADPVTRVCLVPGTCNGIVCYYNLITSSIFLSNPATREFKRLPPTSLKQVTDQKWCQSGVAFGFESANIYDFKVLRLFCTFTENRIRQPSDKGLRAEMFTLSSNTWKQLHWGLDDSLLFSNVGGYFYANSFHFFVHRHNTEAKTIVCCDISSERFTTMELPSIGDHRICFLRVFKDFLSLVCRLEKPMYSEEFLLEIWIMKDYGVVESWTKLYKLGPFLGVIFPWCFWTEDDDALLLSLREGDKLVSCHHNTLHGEYVKIHEDNKVCEFVVYKETLVSIM